MELFDQQAQEELARSTPLADRLRPKWLAEFIGLEHLVGVRKIWGTAGVGWARSL